jgi:hypothetical protein
MNWALDGRLRAEALFGFVYLYEALCGFPWFAWPCVVLHGLT